MSYYQVYCKIVELNGEHVKVACLIDHEIDHIKYRLLDRNICDGIVDIFVGNYIRLHITSGPGWMQMDVHSLKISEMHLVRKLLNIE